ncbi:unnamed protein product [Caenorhabditis brenneri]
MNSQPLRYECLRSVLSYMEANKRIECANRMPSIRKVEKVLPLKIKKLSFSENFFIINQTEYRFGVYRHYGTKVTPQFIQSQNEDGGCRNDVDKYGFEVEGTWYKAIPEDIVMNAREVEEPLRDINTMIAREQEVKTLEMEIVELYGKLGKGCGFEEMRESPEQASQLGFALMKAHEEIDRKTAEIEKAHYDLQCYKCYRDNTPSPFESFIQLRLCDEETRFHATPTSRKFERLIYNKTLPDAMRAVLKLIFGDRKKPVRVTEMDVNQDHSLRLPSDFKLNLRKLNVRGVLGKVCDPLSSIIDATCLPLKEVSVKSHTEFINDFQPELARTAKKLIIGDHYEINTEEWLPVFLTLQNQYVEWRVLYETIPAADFIELIRFWLSEGKRIGTTFSFHGQRRSVTEFFERAVQEFHGAFRENRCITIPMTSFSKVQVSHDLEADILEMKVLSVENEVNVVTENFSSISIN